ncbi:MAG: dihydrodipicolinate reductase C-terminal domain-containing protein [Pyrinomonadaceae bacterium]
MTAAADQILLEHLARSREGFASGALLAAEWIVGKRGFWEFTDVMDEILRQIKLNTRTEIAYRTNESQFHRYQPDLPQLDFLRAVAVILVIGNHSSDLPAGRQIFISIKLRPSGIAAVGRALICFSC